MKITQEDIDAVMANHAFFGGLSDEQMREVVSFSEIREASAESILFQTGDPYHGFYLLLRGAVQVYRLNDAGRMLVLHVIEPGETFAEVPLFDPDASDSYPAVAETLEDSTMMFIPSEPFLAFIDRNPRAALGMLAEMARRLRGTVTHMDALSLHDVKERVARHLWSEAQSAKNPDQIADITVDLGIPKSVLAAELGTVPETLSRALRTLEDEGLILRRGEQIDITDPDRLSRIGGAP